MYVQALRNDIIGHVPLMPVQYIVIWFGKGTNKVRFEKKEENDSLSSEVVKQTYCLCAPFSIHISLFPQSLIHFSNLIFIAFLFSFKPFY